MGIVLHETFRRFLFIYHVEINKYNKFTYIKIKAIAIENQSLHDYRRALMEKLNRIKIF